MTVPQRNAGASAVPGESAQQKRAASAEAPQRIYHITEVFSCQHLLHKMQVFLRFIPFLRKLFGNYPVLHPAVESGILFLQRKVIPNKVTPQAGRAFQSSVLHKCHSHHKQKLMNAYGRDSNHNQSQADPAESEVTQ